MTTTEPLSTTTEEATGHTGADRNAKLGMPTAVLVVGALLVAVGLILGRIRYAVPGGFHWNAVQVGNMCHLVSQATGRPEQAPMCTHAHELLDVSGLLILVGLIMAATGIAVAVCRLRDRADEG